MDKIFKYTVMVGLISCLISPVVSAGESGAYIGIDIGGVALRDTAIKELGAPVSAESDIGFLFAGSAGYDTGKIRVEGEIIYQSNDLDNFNIEKYSYRASGDSKALSLFFNCVVYDDNVWGGKFVPFFTGGIGITKIKVNDFNFVGSGLPNESYDDKTLAFKAGLGVWYNISKKISLDFTYHYFYALEPEFDITEFNYESNNFSFGLTFKF